MIRRHVGGSATVTPRGGRFVLSGDEASALGATAIALAEPANYPG